MTKANGVVEAAKLLGMSYKTFWYRWEKLNMENPSLKSLKTIKFSVIPACPE